MKTVPAQKFLKEYKKLNAGQKKAVDAIEGPVMIIAGPGTGKTTILTLRIANILRRTDTPPDGVLALTFTESGAFSMRKNLVEIIGGAGYRVGIYTFHSFCNEIIKRFPDEFPNIIGAQPVQEVEKLTLLKEIIARSKLLHLKPFGDTFYYLVPLSGKISELKRENVDPGDLKKALIREEAIFYKNPDMYHDKGRYAGEMKGTYRMKAKKLEKTKELQKIYARYQKELASRRLYDYEDMLMEVVRTLEYHKDLLLSLQEEYHYILADEHQDANNVQNRLLELLASFHDKPNLFIVGDEKQAIFRFQGASLENFLYFKKLYTDALLVSLEENYRSVQAILDGAHSVIEKRDIEDAFLRKRLRSALCRPGFRRVPGAGAALELRSFSSEQHEHLFILRDIEKKLSEGVLPHEIAVLYRTNRDALELIRSFEKTMIPFTVHSEEYVLGDIDVRKLVTLLRAISEYGNDEFLFRALHIDFLGVCGLDLYRLSHFAKKARTPLYTVLESRTLLQKARIRKHRKLYALYRLFSSWHTVSSNKNLLEFLDIVVKESGFLAYLLQHEHGDEKLEKLNALYTHLKGAMRTRRDFSLSALISYFDMLEEYAISIQQKGKTKNAVKGVRLMTAHKSKGLEFEYVYIVGAHNGHWGNRRSTEHFAIPRALFTLSHESSCTPPEKDTTDDDERRLFYVALTRARQGVSLSYARESENGRFRLPSRFIEEIDTRYVKEMDTESFEEDLPADIYFHPKRERRISLKDKEFLNELFLEQGLSVTALNNYLACPWSYFYNNLLRVPKAPTKHLMFGNAVHAALKHFFDRWRERDDLGAKGLLRLFENYLMRESLAEEEYTEAYAKGKKALEGFYARYHAEWTRALLNECKVVALFPANVSVVRHLRLRGVLDKVEIIDEMGSVNVVDYKTGAPKSPRAIEGKTRSSRGDYKRQLVFYNLLLSLEDPSRFRMVSGEIDFVEPDLRGSYHKERFFISEEETEDLKELLMHVSREILDLRFWKKRCGERRCEYCTMRDFMQ